MPALLIVWGFLRSGLASLLSFCSKPPGSWIAAALGIALGLWWFGHLKYAAGVAAAGAAAAARSAQIKAKQDAAIAGVTERANARGLDAERKDAETQEAVNNAKNSAATMPNAGGVAITANVADRLRDIQ